MRLGESCGHRVAVAAVVRLHADVETMPKAARAISYSSQSLKETSIADVSVNTGMIHLVVQCHTETDIYSSACSARWSKLACRRVRV